MATDLNNLPEPDHESPPAVVSVLRRSRRVLWIVVALAVPLVFLLGVLATRPPATRRAVDSPLVGKPAPAFDATTIDGEKISLGDFSGRWVLVNFFATWCVPCRIEHPELVRFHQRHRSRGDLEIVGVVYDDAASAVREFRADEGGTWPMVLDPEGRIALDFGVAGIPESFLVDPEGYVVAKLIGGVSERDLEERLAAAGGGR